MASSRKSDVLIIGAGAAGLAAARELSHAGKRVTVVEARDRIGGRVYTVHDGDAALPIELGAEFVHGEVEETFKIVRAAGLIMDELPDEHLWARQGKLFDVPDFWGTVNNVRKDIERRIKRSKSSDFSFADYLERAKLSSEVRQMLTDFVQGYHAAHTERISARSLAAGDQETQDESANRQFRIVGGYDALMQWLRGGLDPERGQLRLGTTALVAKWKKGEVALECRGASGAMLEPLRARALIVTIPHAVLLARTMRFDPALPQIERAVDRLEPGQVFKIVLRFRESFWHDDAFVRERLERGPEDAGQLNFVHSRDCDVPTWWTARPARVPVLTGWCGGPKAESMLDDGESSRVDRAVESVSRLLNVPRRLLDDTLESWRMHDWRADPLSRAAYTYVGVGGTGAQKAMARPVQGTLFFAGEAMDAEQTGTVSGAIASGRRAAKQVLA